MSLSVVNVGGIIIKLRVRVMVVFIVGSEKWFSYFYILYVFLMRVFLRLILGLMMGLVIIVLFVLLELVIDFVGCVFGLCIVGVVWMVRLFNLNFLFISIMVFEGRISVRRVSVI